MPANGRSAGGWSRDVMTNLVKALSNYLRASWMLAGTVRARRSHICMITSDGSTPNPTTRIRLLAELTSDTAITMHTIAHAMTAAIFNSSRFMIVSVATSGGCRCPGMHTCRRHRPCSQGRTAAMPVGVGSAGPA